MITKIKFLQERASLGTEFCWEDIPRFAVIAGVNGAGKTKFLDALNNGIKYHPRDTTVSLEYSGIIDASIVQYIAVNHAFGSLYNQQGATFSGSIEHMQRRQTDVAEQIKNRAVTIPLWEKVRGKIARQLGINAEDLYKMTMQEIVSAIPPDIVTDIENGFNNLYIGEIFKAYQEKMDYIKIENFDQQRLLDIQQIYNIIGFSPPWEVINNLFEKYEFVYRINTPTPKTQEKPKFWDMNNPGNNNIEFGDLSSGEKIIVSLILWAYNRKLGDMNKVLLMDEFDAHLNPSMSKMFIEVIKEKLVNEYGIQVIMTTHSPSTVAHVDDEDLFWMERGKNIRKSSRSEIIPILSDGIMTYQEASSLLEIVVKSHKQIIIFTEGPTDVEHIKAARKKLNEKDIFDIFYCGNRLNGGADKLKQFLIGCPSTLFKDKKIVGIFDCDKEGLSQTEKNFSLITEKENIYRSNSDANIFAILIPPPDESFKKYQNCPIEFLYSKELIEKYGLLAEKRSIAEINKFHSTTPMNTDDYATKNDLWYYGLNSSQKITFSDKVKDLDKEDFKNFKPLFDLIHYIDVLPLITTPDPLHAKLRVYEGI